MKIAFQILIVIAIAAVLAFGSYYYFIGWISIAPWITIGIGIGYLSKSRGNCLLTGAIFGYVLFLVFFFVDYNGNTDEANMIHLILFDSGLSLMGAIAGTGVAFAGFWLKGGWK